MNRKSLLLASSCLVLMGASACTTNESTMSSSSSSKEVADLRAMLEAKKAENAALSSRVAQLESTGGRSAGSAGGDMPPNARPGECYARITIPATFKTVTEQVIDQPASEKITVIPATYKTVTEQVLVREASEKLVVIPATYKTVTEQIEIEPGSETIVEVPAVYETVTEKVKVADGYTTWKRGSNPIAISSSVGGTILQSQETETGEILCLVEVPPKYETVTKKVLKTPATTKTVKTPGKFATVTKQVIDKPATTQVVKVPAEYKTVTKRVIDKPAQVTRVPVPATYKTVTKRVQVSPPQSAWGAVLCDVNTTPDVIKKMQTALAQKGFYRGPIDGIFASATAAAVQAYQRSLGQPAGKLTIETVRQLGAI